ncbi:dihydroorotase, multifunctional complex type [Denitrovibrio acetiphilus DSM 12809]|uniref:Dihydroorotase n=1 Tax=Denitrovibrio acetiphilus (strain DSM 12809 / NBRC 114555 / N2460) TaxID=522772 RepID=D4H834_DENA2|nr:dihydroorotase [Denitrovibrio acetiphilus]ADD68183.1 dihydroorotase, multifunctional complex type [Denitrovibrio acetiphilus DSM 12809]
MKTLLKNCKIVNHDKTIEGNILIDGEIIASLEASDSEKADKVIDCKGHYTIPGIIDMHVHLRDPGFEYKEDIASGSHAAVAGGVTGICPMANTSPINDNNAITKFMIDKGKECGICDIFPIGAMTKRMAGEELTEMGDMTEAGAIGFSDDGLPVASAEVFRRAAEYASQFGSFVISHAEDKSLTGAGVINDGEIATITGLRSIPAESEEVMVARDILMAKLTGAHVHICHISSKGTLELIRWAKAQGINVTCEVTPHHFTLTERELLSYDTNYKMNPPLRSDADVEAMLDGLKKGDIDCIVTDHAPHHIDEKKVEFDLAMFGIIGLQTLLPLSLKLVERNIMSMNDLVRVMSYNPAKLIRKTDRGEIAEGKRADIVIIDENKEYVFDEKMNKSKSMNTPFLGKTLKGAALYTIKNGNVVFEFPV